MSLCVVLVFLLVLGFNMADSKLFMSPDFLNIFIEEYRQFPCLWNVKSKDFSNRNMRDEAWDHLLLVTRDKVPNADLNFLKKKVSK